MICAPVVLFVYNRPIHTRRVLEALENNWLAKRSILYVFADGPKENDSNENLERIKQVEDVIRERTWCAEVVFKRRRKNLGLARNIIEGVTEIVNKFGKVIVLEDDVVTSRGFLKFMNEALDLYENEPYVMHISGYMFPVMKNLPSTFFYNTASCWGWGTWKRAWSKYNDDAHYLMRKIAQSGLISKFDIDNTYNFYGHLEANAIGRMKTWAVRWYASMFLEGGFALHPYPSLVNNIGHDASGTNIKSSSTMYYWPTLADNIKVNQIPMEESKMAREQMKKFHNKHKKRPAIMLRVKRFLREVLISDNSVNKFREILKLPRFTTGTTKIDVNQVIFADNASFLFMHREIFVNEIYRFESDRKDPLIIDAGANIGLGILYFKGKYPDARIIAFEPDDRIYKILKKNCEEHWRTSNVHLHKLALWNEDSEEVQFWHEGADGNRIDVDRRLGENYVKTTVLSKYLHQVVDFLKIDIEGAEYVVLQEAEHLLKNVDHIFIEYHNFIDRQQYLSEILEILKRQGFRYYLSNPGIHQKNPFKFKSNYLGMDFQLNIHAVKQ